MSLINKKILDWWNTADESDSIYATMYGMPFEKDETLILSKHELYLGKDNDRFVYIWGWPGPDGNIYYFKDYGITWKFFRSDMHDSIMNLKAAGKDI